MNREQGQKLIPPETVTPQERRLEPHRSLTPYQEKLVLSVSSYIGFHARRLGAKLGRFNFMVEVEDLIQAGYLGAMDAMQRYDLKSGIRFESFSKRRIQGEMIQAIRRNGNISPNALRNVSRLRRVEAGYIARGESLPSDEELSRQTGLSSSEIAITREFASFTFFSREELMERDHADNEDGDQLEKVTPLQLNELRIEESSRENLQTAMEAVSELERNVIDLEYFGGYSKLEIADLLHLTQNDVIAISLRAIQKMKEALGVVVPIPEVTAEQTVFTSPIVKPSSERRTQESNRREQKKTTQEYKLPMEAPSGYVRLKDLLFELGIGYKAFKKRHIEEGLDLVAVGHGGTIYVSPDGRDLIRKRLEEQGWKPRKIEIKHIHPQAIPALKRLLLAIPDFDQIVGVDSYIVALNKQGSLSDAQRIHIVHVLSETLSPLEMEVILHRIGFDGRYMSLAQVGVLLDRDLKGIKQIEEKAIDKLVKAEKLS